MIEHQAWYERLGRRGPNFKAMCEHAKRRGGYIVETGVAWDKDNFEGQGQSTLIWDWLSETADIRVISIDIRPEAIATAQAQTKNIKYMCGDSIKTLSGLDDEIKDNISVLYLDSYDWTEELNLDSALHHLAELTGLWARLKSDTLIVVDDRHGNGRGKHWIVEAYMESLGIDPVFKNCQIGWIKP
jgi:hypothetical protein